MSTQVLLDNVTVVLNRPKYPGNIGSVARCAKNMGIENVLVVSEVGYEEEKIRQMSTHLAADVVDRIRYEADLGKALSGFHYIVGTTARVGRARPAFQTPREAAAKLVEISQKNRVALLFGSEDAGLTNEELRYGHLLVHIPVSERFRSINLSHAVMILCYEIFLAASGKKTFTPRLATSGELEGMYGHIRDVSLRIGFINPQNPEYWMTSIRRFLSRVELRSREVKIIRGFCRQLDWFCGKQNP
ncbi:MAG: RNA methyltransferase [Pseudomonadota bacterium]|jgi:tRNA/rRNA methyltransferase|nr:RNA methyltransferase [Syntrophobacterales bacterium]MDI9554746.1 RNA methyltransferase [Pseudomonadota bacterium]NLX30718.1 RNA methyltransferase [Deltaproteobacteria bacterium]HNU84626.1 RNA methyltransferase [Syntrophales bacterium]HNZ33688.1 RNA methyltransferase [Syntrophales bacterium]